VTDRIRTTTVRLPTAQADQVELYARVLGITVSELIRTALADYTTRHSASFRARLRRRIEDDQRLLARLADDPPRTATNTDDYDRNPMQDGRGM
jgi:ribbon-helix-helix CopG family protein